MGYTVSITGSTDPDQGTQEQEVIAALTAAVVALPGTVDAATFTGSDGTTTSLIPDAYTALDDDAALLAQALQLLDQTDPNVQAAVRAFAVVSQDIERLDPTAVLPTLSPAGAPQIPAGALPPAPLAIVDPALAGQAEAAALLPQVVNQDGSQSHAVAV